ncbi:MAG: methyltransferase, TIGR04325 family, partial [Methanococcaceae archaeon]
MNDSLKNRIKPFIPERIRRFVSGIHYGWHGSYGSWQDALSKTSGYDSPHILEKVRNSVSMVREGKAAYERDSVLFANMEYSYELLSML